jgi:hypothetical protein
MSIRYTPFSTWTDRDIRGIYEKRSNDRYALRILMGHQMSKLILATALTALIASSASATLMPQSAFVAGKSIAATTSTDANEVIIPPPSKP